PCGFDASKTMSTQPNPITVVPPNLFNARIPVLFLPVNIETRFMDLATGQSELWVRIYPDQIAINSHEPHPTDPEIANGQGYWDAIWRAGKPPASLENIKAP